MHFRAVASATTTEMLVVKGVRRSNHLRNSQFHSSIHRWKCDPVIEKQTWFSMTEVQGLFLLAASCLS